MSLQRGRATKRFNTEGVRQNQRDRQLQGQGDLLEDMAMLFAQLETMTRDHIEWPAAARQNCELWKALMVVELPPMK